MTISYATGAELPVFGLWLTDSGGTLIDFSAGYTFVFKIGHPGQAALLTKATGIAGAVGAGTGPSGTPNVTVTWAANDLALTAGAYMWFLTATTAGGLARVFSGPFRVTDVAT
jgi:hypothetical protein